MPGASTYRRAARSCLSTMPAKAGTLRAWAGRAVDLPAAFAQKAPTQPRGPCHASRLLLRGPADRPDRQPGQDHHRGRHPALCRGVHRHQPDPHRRRGGEAVDLRRADRPRHAVRRPDQRGARHPAAGPGIALHAPVAALRRAGEDRRHGQGDAPRSPRSIRRRSAPRSAPCAPWATWW